MGELLLNILSKFLVALFLVGLVGSAIVVIITFFEDGRLLLERDEPKVKERSTEREEIATHAHAREAF
jgi:hypothetical protein